jgi:hypothetical protein
MTSRRYNRVSASLDTEQFLKAEQLPPKINRDE